MADGIDTRESNIVIEVSDSGDSPNSMVAAKPTPTKLTVATNTISAIILSFGMVSALHLFIWLAYLHPDAANTLIPLMFVPLLDRLIRMIRGKE